MSSDVSFVRVGVGALPLDRDDLVEAGVAGRRRLNGDAYDEFVGADAAQVDP